ncbi:MAG: hypothetical protein KatS3mg113_0525 [Planctomycetaceae bacterium]|nr:MAG: hypothetical protein KatS3mg113_0525 [Planctomycetaceae bacterium]
MGVPFPKNQARQLFQLAEAYQPRRLTGCRYRGSGASAGAQAAHLTNHVALL